MGDSRASSFSLRSHRIPRASDYQLIARKGTRVGSRLLAMRSIQSPDGSVRIAFVVKRRSGNAVLRNRVRRVLRDVFYRSVPDMSEPRWAMVLYQGGANDADSGILRSEAAALMRKARWIP